MTPEPTASMERPPAWPTARYMSVAAIVIVFGLLLQIRCLTFDKVIDDNDLIYSVQQRGCGANPADCFRHPVFMLYYRPLFTATFALGEHLHSHDTVWYHLENLAIHALACMLAFWFFRLIFARQRIALLSGLIFTLHPLQVTVTTFIGGRPDSMALVFLLLFAIGAWNTGLAPRSESNAALKRLVWLLMSVVGYSAAVFTKEQCLPVLALLPLLLWWPGHAFAPRRLPLLSLYLVPVGLYIFAARQIIPFSSVSSPHWSTALHVEMVARTIAYFGRILLLPAVGPLHQSTLGPWDQTEPLTVLAGAAIAIVWLAVCIFCRRTPSLRFCLLWSTLTLLPCINLIPIPSQFASCYRAVIPLLGFAGVAGAALDRILVWFRAAPPFAWCPLALLVSFYTWETGADVPAWRNNRTLMEAEIYGDPNFVPAYGGLGFWAETRLDWKEVDRAFTIVAERVMPSGVSDQAFAPAVDSAACQRRLWSQAGLRYHPRGYLELVLPHRGWARQQQGHFSAAEEDYRHVLLLNPNDENSRANLRNCYMANGQIEKALSLYRNAGEVVPRSVR